MKNKNNGLRQEIAKAETKEIVNNLLVISTQYTNASEHTKRRWSNTARKRLKQLAAVLMLFVAVGCAPSGVPTSKTVGTVEGMRVKEIEIKGHTYLTYAQGVIIHAEHCKCKVNE